MKAAFVGIDLFYPALPALEAAGCEIVRVFTCRTDNVTEFNTRVCEYARARAVPLQTDRIRPADIDDLVRRGCDLLLCGGYYHRIPVRDGLYMANIHPSLLPVGRGAWPMPVTILRGLDESGVTIHRLAGAFDAGDILLQERVRVAPDETLQTLTRKQQALLPDMVKRLVSDLPALWDGALPQSEARAEYWPCPSEPDWTVREDMPPGDADRILRAFYGYEVVYEGGGERWELIEAALSDTPAAGLFCRPCAGGFICAKRARRIA